MAPKHPKRPRDANQWGKFMVDLATGGATEPAPEPPSAAAEMGRKGGQARAKTLNAEKRREIARKAAKTRWK
jgi:hypothetical protein